jgi:hypothetical protein
VEILPGKNQKHEVWLKGVEMDAISSIYYVLETANS